MDQVRIGILGTARIALRALIEAERMMPEARITAVASRSEACAEIFSAQHGIGQAYSGYAELLADPGIDAVYIPLPNSLHARWTLAALAAGKHVLCEKPLAANAEEAEQVAAAAASCGLVVMEAMHYRYHPLIQLLGEHAEAIGPVRHIQCWTSFAIRDPADIRYDYDLGGGALMDGGCYAIDAMRMIGGEPTVIAALADPLRSEPRIDRSMAVSMSFPNGAGGWFESSFTPNGTFRADLHVIGENGDLWLDNFIAAHDGALVVTTGDTVLAEEVANGDTTFTYQLRAFTGAVLRGEPYVTDASHAAGTMRLIDETYRKAGLPVRPGIPAEPHSGRP